MKRRVISILSCALSSALLASFYAWPQAAYAQADQGSLPVDSPQQIIGATHYEGWYTFNGNLEAQKYSEADQITPQNINNLAKAWEVHTGDFSDGSGKTPLTDWSATPLFVNDTVYVSTPFYRVFAIAPDTGKVKWTYDTHSVLETLTQPELKTRGVAYWQAASPRSDMPCQKIIYVGTMDAKLHAVDADSGRKCEGFANGGVLDVNQWNTINNKWPLSVLQPPTVYKDTLFIGWAGKDWVDAVAPPGTLFAVDARSGRLKWVFHALPQEATSKTGTANIWASISIDPEHGILYVPVSTPSPDFYGGNRKEDLPFATSVTALDADSGKVLWSRQIVHHDLWDYDTNSPPVLVDIDKNGSRIPALVQSSKMGIFFVLNRLTGEPIYPIEERDVPQSDVPGEQSSRTQPYAATPEPTVPDRFPGIFRLADIASFGECSRTMSRLRYDGRYTPPSLRGTLAFPSTPGGVEWGGGAVDPRSGVYVVNSSYVAQIYQLLERREYEEKAKNGSKFEYFPMNGAPYGFYLRTFLNFLGMPCLKPPYGTLSAYDLNSGKLLWKKPFGEIQKWGFYMPLSWGSVTIGAPLITRSGLIFIGASMDARVRAVDLKSGEVVWKALVDAPAVANPATYMYKGRQYVVFVAGGNAILKQQESDQVAAFALK
jgi:quinoprotein glucose dehydrogenase